MNLFPEFSETFGDYRRSRRAAGTYVNGRFVQGDLTQAKIRMSVQQARERDLRDLPEGQRTVDAKVLIVQPPCDLRTANETAKTEADTVCINDEEWMVVKVWDNTTTRVLPHMRAIALRKDR